MSLLRVNASGSAPVLHGGSGDLDTALRDALLYPGPVTLLLHGYKYRPGPGGNCPHDHIFALNPAPGRARIVSWPRHLGHGRGTPPPGVALAFGWNARGALRSVYLAADVAAQALAALVQRLHTIDPGREVHVLAHSMGARVALGALHRLPAGAIRRIILMAAAEFESAAEAALATPAGRTAQVVHVTSRENDLYDFLLERLVTPPRRGDRALAHHVSAPNLRTLMLDDTETLTALRRLGYPVAPPQRLVCHWSPYLRPGVFPLYRALLVGTLPMHRLDRALPPTASRRWQRFLPALADLRDLPLLQKASL